jgi:hypothetical protein
MTDEIPDFPEVLAGGPSSPSN